MAVGQRIFAADIGALQLLERVTRIDAGVRVLQDRGAVRHGVARAAVRHRRDRDIGAQPVILMPEPAYACLRELHPGGAVDADGHVQRRFAAGAGVMHPAARNIHQVAGPDGDIGFFRLAVRLGRLAPRHAAYVADRMLARGIGVFDVPLLAAIELKDEEVVGVVVGGVALFARGREVGVCRDMAGAGEFQHAGDDRQRLPAHVDAVQHQRIAGDELLVDVGDRRRAVEVAQVLLLEVDAFAGPADAKLAGARARRVNEGVDVVDGKNPAVEIRVAAADQDRLPAPIFRKERSRGDRMQEALEADVSRGRRIWKAHSINHIRRTSSTAAATIEPESQGRGKLPARRRTTRQLQTWLMMAAWLWPSGFLQ